MRTARVVDPTLARTSAGDRPLVEVAVGILLRPDNSFLLTSRPEGKPYAGYWEFPGGKLESDESVEQALVRELYEEIGLKIEMVTAWKQEVVDYPHALVRLHFCRVTQWAGELVMREMQNYSWQQLPVQVGPVLPGTLPVLDWLALERGFQGSLTS